MISLPTTLTRIAALFLSAFLAHAAVSHAAPANDTPFVLVQPDGTAFEARLFGDEWMNGIETVDGYTVVQDATTGFWTYARTTSTGALVSTIHIVGRDGPLAGQPGLRPTAAAAAPAPEGFGPDPAMAAHGPHRALVLLVQFTDQKAQTSAAQWRNVFFGARASIRQHYRAISQGALDITPAGERHGTADDGVVGWLTLQRPHPDFGGTIDGRAPQLARDAMAAAARHVDFAGFDTDGDGRVSTSELLVTVVVAGHEASEPGAYRPAVWSHQSAIPPVVLDGVQLSPYAMVGETACGTAAGLAALTHEVDRLLGVADIAAAEVSAVPPLATLRLTTPNGGEAWHFNSRRLIQWTSTALTGRVSLALSRDGGATWTVLAASTDNDGAFNWVVTPPATNRARVRVCSLSTPSLCDASDANFRIAAAVITVLTPNGGEAWVINTTRQIQWTSAGPAGSTVRIEVSRDRGTTWTVIVPTTGNDGAHNWLVVGPPTTEARIRVCSVATPSVCDSSNGSFTIAAGALTLLTPNGGETWSIGSPQRIAWTSSGAVGPNVRVELSRAGVAPWTAIFTSVGNDGAQNWTVTGPATADARIRICSVSNPSICDTSDGTFTITDGSVRVLTPNGGESWPVGGTRRIEWRSSRAGSVRIELSRNSGVSWTTIFANIANDGAQNWTVTGPVTNDARIRVCNINVAAACDTSDADFAITRAADLTVRLIAFSPRDVLGGQAWQVRVRTANDGVVAAPASRTDVFIGPTGATGTIRILGLNVPPLPPGAVSEQEATIAFPFTVPPDTYFVFARVDATRVVPEIDEDNEFVLPSPTLLVH